MNRLANSCESFTPNLRATVKTVRYSSSNLVSLRCLCTAGDLWQQIQISNIPNFKEFVLLYIILLFISVALKMLKCHTHVSNPCTCCGALGSTFCNRFYAPCQGQNNHCTIMFYIQQVLGKTYDTLSNIIARCKKSDRPIQSLL